MFPAQGPFVKTKTDFGYSGVVEYDETNDTIRCHECGKWFHYLGPHLRAIHKTTTSAHKIKFGLNLNMPLCGKRLSEQRRNQLTEQNKMEGWKKIKRRSRRAVSKKKRQNGNATEASKNRYGLCDLQMKTRYEFVKAEVGHQPTTQELKKHDPALLSAIERRSGTLNKFRESIGDRPMTAQEHQMVSEADLMALLRKWAKENGRVPRAADFKKATGEYPQYTTYYGRFGSWSNAISLAGL
jgi:hypothetical protein